MDSIRFWAYDNPNGWYATYVIPEAPYYNTLPLMGQAIIERDGKREQVGVVGTSKILPADEVPDWIFQFYVMLGSLSAEQENELYRVLEAKGRELEQKLHDQTTRVEREPRREPRRGERRARAATNAAG